MSAKQTSAPRPITSKVHDDKIVDIFRGLEKGSALDLSCGEGALTWRLEELGHRVSCSDIQPEICKIPGKEVRRGDLNHEIPFEDKAFDYVACVNVLHRLYGVDRAISEIARVLKPGGLAIISFPNYATIVRRMRFLFFGSISDAVNNQRCRGVSTAPEANFRNCLMVPQVALCLERHSLHVESLEIDRRKKGSRTYFPIAALVALVSRCLGAKRSARLQIPVANHRRVLLGGPHLVILARKNG
jgi:SAM-dependent methyltransferase